MYLCYVKLACIDVRETTIKNLIDGRIRTSQETIWSFCINLISIIHSWKLQIEKFYQFLYFDCNSIKWKKNLLESITIIVKYQVTV